ncbi:dorsal-ventral patterning protein Sog isoform X2 [Daktulosphaira vitifoliae]|uniref:dorsal-ventral patterning protein Sog isoform X2 n=1 Tax=Daktulosphaira vitifoliae TaxID=58002 RepID=UPI0021AA0444|nr:dorsal-ventral patterning protein Sog isoform X2 [Daktulosphaira vitifoliae]
MAFKWPVVAFCLLATIMGSGLAARKKSPLLEENAVPKKPNRVTDEFIQDPPEEEEKSLKHFAAVLTGKSVEFKKSDYPSNFVPETELEHVATGRFSFYRKHLYFSFYTNKPDRPRLVQFNDANGNIIEEITLLSGTIYQNATDKICGVWRRVSKDYKRLLREEKISVSLVWDTAIIVGQLFRFKALDTEVFSSLMTGYVRDTGGTAIVSISTISPSIHMQIVFNGGAVAVIGQDSGSFSVKLKYANGDERTVIDEIIKVEKLTNKSMVIEVRSPVAFSDLNALSKKDLVVVLESKQQPGLKLQGLVKPRVFCDIYQTLVVSNSHQKDLKNGRTSGIGWMFINKDGALEYRVKFNNNAVSELTIASTESRVSSIDLSESIVLNWSNGTITTMGPVHLEQLYAEDLGLISVSSGFRGRLSWRPVADARDSGAPMLLSSHDEQTPMVGLLWAMVDSDCTLQYEVILSGPNVKNRKFELYIEDSPLLVHGAPIFRRLLEEFEGPIFEGYIIGLSQEELLRLNINLVHVDLWDPKLGQSILKTEWKHVNIPNVCIVKDSIENDSNNILMNNDESEQQHTSLLSCYHGQKYYQHGAQWTSTVDECYMCNCHYGRVICDLIICPIVQCAVPSAKPGTCCPTCEDNILESQRNSTNSCWLAGQQFQAGSSWHPYLPPNGFDTCTLCHCNSTSLKIKCQRTDCPVLECDQRVAIRPTKRSCCKACPSTFQSTTKPNPIVQLTQGDQQATNDNGSSDVDVLNNGGCSYPVGGPYENGQEWHPKIYSHGEVKCINCKCKDGKVRCDRKKCPKWSSCSDPCCAATCRRHKRHPFKL